MLPFDALRPSETPPGLLDSALRVAELPLRVHPLIEKRPLLKDWPARATNDAGQIERWLEGSRSYGIICDSVVVIDWLILQLEKAKQACAQERKE